MKKSKIRNKSRVFEAELEFCVERVNFLVQLLCVSEQSIAVICTQRGNRICEETAVFNVT